MTRLLRSVLLMDLSIMMTAPLTMGCLPHPGTKPNATPPAGSDAEQVFRSLRDARQRAGKTPPGWVSRLVPIAEDGARKLADGGNGDAIRNDVSTRAAFKLMKDVQTWTFVSDALTFEWPPPLLARNGLAVAIGTSLMQTAAPGRHAIVLIILETEN